MDSNFVEVIFEGGNDSEDILEQFLSSNYYKNNSLDIVRFLDKDLTIDIEKLELAIILLIEHLENSVNLENPIYINLGNMKEYIALRELDDMERITEECSFILGFSQAVADDNEINNKIIVRFEGNYV